jgi:hypothetical protein
MGGDARRIGRDDCEGAQLYRLNLCKLWTWKISREVREEAKEREELIRAKRIVF